eukprot:1580265-Prorocentrum_lima.AAC.1
MVKTPSVHHNTVYLTRVSYTAPTNPHFATFGSIVMVLLPTLRSTATSNQPLVDSPGANLQG